MLVQSCPKCGSSRVQHNFHEESLLTRLAGFNHLLCNNCSHEYTGFSPFGVKRSRHCHILVKSQAPVSRQQRSPRKNGRFAVQVFLRQPEGREVLADSQTWARTPLNGYTRNLSRIGLSFVLPEARFTDEYLAQDKHRLLVRLQLPVKLDATHAERQPMQLHVTAVRYEQLDEDEVFTGWLVGARITWISAEDGARFARLVDGL